MYSYLYLFHGVCGKISALRLQRWIIKILQPIDILRTMVPGGAGELPYNKNEVFVAPLRAKKQFCFPLGCSDLQGP